VLAATVQLKLAVKGSIYLDSSSLITAIVIALYTVFIPGWGLSVLIKHRRVLDENRIRYHYEYMYHGIHLTRNKWTIYFWPIYMWRKWVYLMLPIIFNGHP